MKTVALQGYSNSTQPFVGAPGYFRLYPLNADSEWPKYLEFRDGAHAAVRAIELSPHHAQVLVCNAGDQRVMHLVGNVVVFPEKKALGQDIIRILGDVRYADPDCTLQTCPTCERFYVTDLPPRTGSPMQREQHLSGICSQACWDIAFGAQETDKD